MVSIILSSGIAQALSIASVSWTMTGPGSTSATTANDCLVAKYHHQMPPSSWDFSHKYWYAQSTAPATEMYTFNWDYNAFHSWYLAQAQLDVFADGPSGRQYITLVNSYGQGTWNGTSSIQLHQGYAFGFRIRGYHYDGTRLYTGTVTACDEQPSDSTPPVITPGITGTLGNNNWYTSDVTVAWNVSDPDSAITATSGCDPVNLSTDTAGTALTCEATSDGGTASESVTVRRDATPPTVTYTGNAGTYTVDQTVAIDCSSSDSLSGIAADTCTDVNGNAYTFTIGTNSLSATATDNAGNQGNGSASFTVAVTYDSLCALTQRFATKAGAANSLCAKLNAAQAAAARGNTKAADGSLKAYVNELSAQAGKSIDADKAALLQQLAGQL